MIYFDTCIAIYLVEEHPVYHTQIEMALSLRLAAWLGTSPDVWLGMQTQWDLWQAEQQPTPKIRPLERLAA